MLREEIKNLLLGALDKELKVEGVEIRTYLIETLVENLLKLEDSEEKLEMAIKPAKDFDQIIKAQMKEAPQVQAEEPILKGKWLSIDVTIDGNSIGGIGKLLE